MGGNDKNNMKIGPGFRLQPGPGAPELLLFLAPAPLPGPGVTGTGGKGGPLLQIVIVAKVLLLERGARPVATPLPNPTAPTTIFQISIKLAPLLRYY